LKFLPEKQTSVPNCTRGVCNAKLPATQSARHLRHFYCVLTAITVRPDSTALNRHIYWRRRCEKERRIHGVRAFVSILGANQTKEASQKELYVAFC
jgi:hypothetical protein